MRYVPVLALILAGCSSGTVMVDRPTVVKVPVSQPCVSGERPEAVASLKALHPDWESYSFQQKTMYFAIWALENRSYGEGVNAATGACK